MPLSLSLRLLQFMPPTFGVFSIKALGGPDATNKSLRAIFCYREEVIGYICLCLLLLPSIFYFIIWRHLFLSEE